jgi:glyoxylase-like metal-dependent hydrolase (beta-lactamase superfamily II)
VAEEFPEARRLAHVLDAPLISDIEVYLSDRARQFREPHGIDESDDGIAWTRSAARAAPLDMLVAGGERIDLGDREVEILHVPGHSRGHLAIWDPSTGALAVSDAVLGTAVPFADGSPAFPPTYRYVDSYRKTIRRIAALPFSALLTAHYPRKDKAGDHEFLRQSLDYTKFVDESILAALHASDRGLTLAAMLDELNPVLGTWPQDGRIPALAFPVMGHLEQFEADGAVQVHTSGGRPTWIAA